MVFWKKVHVSLFNLVTRCFSVSHKLKDPNYFCGLNTKAVSHGRRAHTLSSQLTDGRGHCPQPVGALLGRVKLQEPRAGAVGSQHLERAEPAGRGEPRCAHRQGCRPQGLRPCPEPHGETWDRAVTGPTCSSSCVNSPKLSLELLGPPPTGYFCVNRKDESPFV